MLSLVVYAAITLSLQFEFISKLNEAGDYINNGEMRNQLRQVELIIMKNSYDFIGYGIFTFSCAAYYL